MNKKLIPLILAGTTILTACNEENTASNNSATTTPVATIAKEDAIAVVNGKYISKAALTTLENEIAQRARGQSFPKEKLVEELIQRELLTQDAIQKQLDKSAEFAKRLETVKSSLLSQEAIQNHLKSNPVTDAELEAEYNNKTAQTGTEYKARHILVKTEEEAKQLIEELNKGADFVELAKSKSTGPSGPQGGDLGWFPSGQMVAPFSEAVIALEDNKFTSEPVETQFGWHVILREGSRTQTPPPFESVKEQIRPMMQRQKMMDYMTSLRQQAKVEVFLAKTEEKEKAEVTSAEAPESTDAPVSEAADKAETKIEDATTDVKTEVTETATQVKEKVVESTENAVDKIAETVKSATEDATAVITDTVDKANETAAESKSKASESVTKTLDAITK